jgi:hypothetical protein
MPIIVATQKAEIRRITVQKRLRQIVHKNLSQKYPAHRRASRVDQVLKYLLSTEFNPQYHKKKIASGPPP